MMFKENRLIGLTTAQLAANQKAIKAATAQTALLYPTTSGVISNAGSAAGRGLSTAAPVIATGSVQPHVTSTVTSNAPLNPYTSFDQAQAVANQEYIATGSVSPLTQAHMDQLNPSNAQYFAQLNNAAPDHGQAARNAQALGANDLTGAGGKGLTGSALIAKQLNDLPAQRDAQLAAINAAGGDGFNVSQQFAQQEADLKAKLAQQQVTDAANQQADLKGHLGTTQGAAPTAVTPVNGNRFQGAGDAGVNRQAFITQQRAQGKTDAQIRQMINTLPLEQTGGVASTQPTTPAPIVPPASSTNGTGTPPASTTTPSTTGATTPPAGKDGANVPPPINPQANVLRQLAATETDPIMKIALNASADQLDAIGVQQDPMGQGQFNQGADAKAIGSPYDAIQTILNNATTRAKTTENSTQSFLNAQLDRTDKYNASQQENINNQLQFQNDKAVRDQTDFNKKEIDHQTIMLALEGGFGSNDGNNEIATARQKGEQAIQDLNKQYGFKMTDVSLQFTQMHNDAHDNYQQNWLKATDDFETKVNNLDLQGISNQGAKASAISTAYKSYVSDIKTARIDYAKTITDATKMVQEAHQSADKLKYDEKKAASDMEWDKYKFGVTSSLAALKEQNDQAQTALAAGDRAVAAVDRQDQKSLTAMNTVTNQLNSRINSDPIIKEALLILPKYNTVKNVYTAAVEQEKLYAAGKIDKKSMNFTDQVLISNFNKLTDPSSVVRESEYARSSAGLSLIESIRAKVKSITDGGVLTANARKELFDVATTLNDSYTEMFNQKSQQYYLQLGQYNANVPPQYQMTPEQFGLPVPKTASQQYNLEQMAPEGLFPQGNPFESNIPTSDSSGYQTFNFGSKKVTAAPVMISALARADQAFFADTGNHLDVNSSFRSGAQQQQAYDRFQKGEIALAAKPGTSYHEKGMAVDVTNWKEAEQYLISAGIYPLPKNLRSKDPAHFSIGESPIS